MRLLTLILALALGVVAAPAMAQPAAWSEPNPPFRIVGDIYYVGSKGLGAYLIRSPQGAILLDGTLAGNAPMIEANIRLLGFNPRDVKVLIASHAHYDHAAGLAKLKADTRAVFYASAADKPYFDQGRHPGDNPNKPDTFPAVKVDRVLTDGETVRVGGVAMTATLTPGHTPGCTTWSTTAIEDGKTLRVVFPCSLSVAGNVLVGNRTSPDIVDQYRRSFARLKAMKADVMLPGHPEFGQVLEHRQESLSRGAWAYVDPAALPAFIRASETAFEAELAKAKAAR